MPAHIISAYHAISLPKTLNATESTLNGPMPKPGKESQWIIAVVAVIKNLPEPSFGRLEKVLKPRFTALLQNILRAKELPPLFPRFRFFQKVRTPRSRTRS